MKPTQHTFSDRYLGNSHPRYSIDVPALRKIARTWMKSHAMLSHKAFTILLTSLVKGRSSTEKCMAGILLDYSAADQRKFNPKLFNHWLDHLEGWAEVDSLCTGDFMVTEIPHNWIAWQSLLDKLSKSKNINKRRASLVLLCSPLRNHHDEKLVALALEIIERLKHEKDIRITKAISWVLRTMEKHYRIILTQYIDMNMESLPKIAVRETMIKLKTGTKNKKKEIKQL